MTALVTTRVHQLAGSLAELKTKVRAALATELATAVSTAVRDVLVVALIDRLVTPARTPSPRPRAGGWPEDGYDREQNAWGESRDPWADTDEYDPRDRAPARYAPDGRSEPAEPAPVPAGAAAALGVTVGRWWLARKGNT